MEKLRIVIKTTLVWGVLFLLVIAVRSFAHLPSVAGPLDSLSESFHVEDLYTYWTRDAIAEEYSDVQDNIVLVDVTGLQTRGELAVVLNEIADAEPSALALDLIFAPLSMADSAQDHQLVRALKRFPKLILASNCHPDLQGAHMEHSFFVDSFPNAIEGEAWLAGSVVRNFRPVIEENEHPSLSYCIAEAMGVPVKSVTEEQPIYFSPVSVFTWIPSKETINMQYLKGKMILVGDAQDLRDFHKVPLLTNAEGRMPGVLIHLASVLTLAANRPIRFFPKYLNTIIEWLLLWLLCWLFCLWEEFPMGNWYQLIISFLLSALLMGVGACIFLADRVVFSAFIFLIGCPLVALAKDIADLIYKKIKI